MLDFLGRSSKDRNPWVYANELRPKALRRLHRRKARQRLQDWDAEWEDPPSDHFWAEFFGDPDGDSDWEPW